uniref:AAA domain-containing protein n=1 Tax=Parastrongyloides trichosuri TaxID=131310 RepID=A0A0N5A1C1_PARTI
MVKSIPFVPLHGRSNEASKIYNLIIDSISKKTPLSIYVGGKPGTGKTATLRQIIDSLSVKKNVENVYMSCTSCQSKVQLYREITLKFLNKTFPSCTALKNIEKFFNEQDKFILLVLDEIDFLTSKSQEMLYMVFDWPAMFPGKVGVVGIANTLDLPKRLLPKLKKGTIPVTVEFQPYSKDELIEILTEHLKDENFGMDGKNIEFIARKIALKSGDVRTALSVTKKTLLDLQEDDDEVGNDENNAFKEPVLETPKPKKNALTVVMSTIRNIEASPLVRAKIPLQPKIILAILLRLTSKKKGISLTETLILSAYQKTQSLLKLPELKRNELIDALSVLESQGLVSYYKNKLILNVDASTAKIVISDNVLIGEIDKINF